MSIGILLISIACIIMACGIILNIITCITNDDDLSLKSIFWGD